jgi:hypothetical protein
VSRQPAEPVEVWLSGDRPARFVWRGRLYTVLAIITQRTTAGDAPDAPPGQPGRPAGLRRDCWRVEAAPGKNVPPAVYELCYERAADRWLLSRGWD